MGKNKIIYIVIAVFVLLLALSPQINSLLHKNNIQATIFPTAAPSPSPEGTHHEFEYPGVNGKNALELLRQHATVETAPSGLVTSINGDKADDKKHEFWAFYVNGKMAQVGPAEYMSKSTDTIEWKIETY